MGNTFFFQWEVSLMEWLQKNMGGFGEFLAKAFSELGSSTVLMALMLVVYFAVRKEAGKRAGIAFMLSTLLFSQIKGIICRRRPYMDHENIKCLQKVDSGADEMDVVAQGYSMPSGHAAGSAAGLGAVAVHLKKKWLSIIIWIAVLFVGISRFCVGVHYPTDIIFGFAIGILCIFLESLTRRFIKKDIVRYALYVVLALPGLFYCRNNDYFTALGATAGMLAGFLFEARFVNFADTKNWLFKAIRVVVAVGIYFVLNTLLKMPFSKEFLNSGTLAAGLVRSARYGIIMFLACGVWPMLFTKLEGILQDMMFRGE